MFVTKLRNTPQALAYVSSKISIDSSHPETQIQQRLRRRKTKDLNFKLNMPDSYTQKTFSRELIISGRNFPDAFSLTAVFH